jgi:hypothetical protein
MILHLPQQEAHTAVSQVFKPQLSPHHTYIVLLDVPPAGCARDVLMANHQLLVVEQPV